MENITQRIRLCGIFLWTAVLLFISPIAFAEPIFGSSAASSGSPLTDKAAALIDLLFRGRDAVAGTISYDKSLVALADGLRHALGVYNIAMLVVGSLLLFYHMVAMIADTAQEGIVLGRRANKVWAPVRLVFAVGLLVPVTGGLSSGQYLIVRIAETGSALASHAWQKVANATYDNLTTIVQPRPPNVATFVVTATEMELCRTIYQAVYNASLKDQSYLVLGSINDSIAKIPAGRLTPEVWRYSNTLNATLPICGEYHFAGYRESDAFLPLSADTSGLTRIAAELQDFAHAQTNEVIAHASALASRSAPAFLGTTPSTIDFRNDFVEMTKEIQKLLDAQLKKSDTAGKKAAGDIVERSSSGGWIDAARLIPELIRLQQSYGELVSHALPDAVEPLLDHQLPVHTALLDALDGQTSVPARDRIPVFVGFYSQLGRVLSSTRQWFYDTELSKGLFGPVTGLDLRDHMTVTTDSAAAFNMFASAIDTRAMADGVWGITTDSKDQGYPFAASVSFFSANPFTGLAEFGRRQCSFGVYLLGLSGSVISIYGAMAPAALTALIGVLLLTGGMMLIFIIPFLPFVRFMIAVLLWLLNVFEAVIAMPIVAIAHLTPSGDGLSGSAAKQAYRLWLALMIRPLLTLAGLIIGFLLLAVGLSLVIEVLSPFADAALPSNNGLLIVSNLACVLLFDVFAMVVANAAFKGIYWLPDQALRWISPFVSTEDHVAESSSIALTTSGHAPHVSAIASVTNVVSSAAGAMGINIGVASSASGGAGEASNANRIKAALFPLYQRDVSSPSVASTTIHASSVNVTATEGKLRPSLDDKGTKKEDKFKPQNLVDGKITLNNVEEEAKPPEGEADKKEEHKIEE